MSLEAAASLVSRIGMKYTDEKILYNFVKEKEGYMNVSGQLSEIGKLEKISEILDAINRLKSDILCLVKQEALTRDESYQKAMTEFMQELKSAQPVN